MGGELIFDEGKEDRLLLIVSRKIMLLFYFYVVCINLLNINE